MGGLSEMDGEVGGGEFDDEELNAAMEEELAKGQGSDVPENVMATTSLLKDKAQQKEPFTSREEFGAALSGELGAIKQKKAELYEKFQSGESLSSSQVVGLGVLALGLMAAGGAIKGKKGIGMGGEAFNLGGAIFLRQNKDEREDKNRLLLSQIKSLDNAEAATNKAALENKLAPMRTEEKIGAQVEARRRMVANGTIKPGMSINVNTGGLVKGELPPAVQNELMKTTGAVSVGEQLATELSKLPDTVKGTISNQISKQFSTTERGKLESKYAMYRRILQSAIEGKRGSDQDNAIFSQIVNGDFTASGPTQAKLIRQANQALNDIMYGEIETFQELGTAEGVERFKQRLKGAAGKGGSEGSGDPLPGLEDKKAFTVNGKKVFLTLEEATDLEAQGDDIKPFRLK